MGLIEDLKIDRCPRSGPENSYGTVVFDDLTVIGDYELEFVVDSECIRKMEGEFREVRDVDGANFLTVRTTLQPLAPQRSLSLLLEPLM